MAETVEAQRLVRELRLDRPELREFRKLWINVIALAKAQDPALYDRLMGLPEDLPNLAPLRPPGGNSRPEGVAESWYERRRRGALPLTY